MKSKERREEPLGTMCYQTSSKRSPPFWLLIGARKTEARTAATVWNWSGNTLPPGALIRAIFFPARLDLSSSPLSAPGSPRMPCFQQFTGIRSRRGGGGVLDISLGGEVRPGPSYPDKTANVRFKLRISQNRK